jgi:phospholipase C
MDSRRDFLKKVALLSAGGGLAGMLPGSVQRAFAIDPAPGSTYLDAEHVVILMQENRSFDHAYGSLRGVRGFNDPRAMTLPDGNPVWLQTDANGHTYAPFRLNLKDSNATWMGCLPHSRESQVGAGNHGKHDRWLIAKRVGGKDPAPLTLGFYNRKDLPFYYGLADAFTICDQNFCSAMTCTTPNRLYLWSGTIKAQPALQSKANLDNSDADFDTPVSWKTFPERLEENNISWRVYQNELSIPTGQDGDHDVWLSNFGDNPLEYFTQYHVRFSSAHRLYLVDHEKSLAAEVKDLESQTPSPEQAKNLKTKRNELEQVRRDLITYTAENFEKLSGHEQNLFRKAFTVNTADSDYRELATLTYDEGGTTHQMLAPKGDVLHQFRDDVRSGKLPTVSWIVAPENFSDHPAAPWYGAWYLSETFDILTQNPEVWKKTIFILCYDENDGYFDHVPPFMPPHPGRPGTGKVSSGIDAGVEQESPEQDQAYRAKHPHDPHGADPIGLGFRVPLVIASPWSRGGYVNSQVCDHTSILQFLEKFLSAKTRRKIHEPNISEWRRTVCGDLTSVFRPYYGETIHPPTPVERTAFLSLIDQAQFKPAPSGFKSLSAEEITQARANPLAATFLPQQESGVRASCALPYELAVDGRVDAHKNNLTLRFSAGKKIFGQHAAGAPFFVYAPGKVRAANGPQFEAGRVWNYAVAAGDTISDTWSLADFSEDKYHLRAHGPNGFFREFCGTAKDPLLEITLQPSLKLTEPDALRLINRDGKNALTVLVNDLAYGGESRTIILAPHGDKNSSTALPLEMGRSFGWYDLSVRVADAPEFARRYAGRIENGRESFSDPCMGRV